MSVTPEGAGAERAASGDNVGDAAGAGGRAVRDPQLAALGVRAGEEDAPVRDGGVVEAARRRDEARAAGCSVGAEQAALDPVRAVHVLEPVQQGRLVAVVV